MRSSSAVWSAWRAFVVGAVLTTVPGCLSTKHVRLAASDDLPAARLTEQHEFDGVHVYVWRLDRTPVREPGDVKNPLELEIDPGPHVLECTYAATNVHSSEKNIVEFTAESGRHYVVRAAQLQEGFWKEFGKRLQSSIWNASEVWVAWVEDAESKTVVGGVKPTKDGLFSSSVPDGAPRSAAERTAPPPSSYYYVPPK